MKSNVYTTLSVIRGSHRYNKWLYRRIEQHVKGHVIDIGSGLGDIARQFIHPAVSKVTLTDYAKEMVEDLQAMQLPLKKHHVQLLNIADVQSVKSYQGDLADTITCVNVLEHIKDDVGALVNMKQLLKTGGKVVIFVPALPAIYGTLDTHVEHFRRYTKKSLSQAMVAAGFKVQQSYYMNFMGIFTWFLAGRILKQKKFHKDACRVLDHMVPLLRLLECLGPPAIGQSLIMVGQK